jgi:hypothetical protein
MEILLDNPRCLGTIQPLVRSPALHEASGVALEPGHDTPNKLVTFLLQVRQNSSSEENLSSTNPVPSSVHSKLFEHNPSCALTFQIALWHVLTKNFVTLSKFGERKTVGKTCASNPNTLEDTIAPELI